MRALAQESADQKTDQAPVTDEAVTSERDARKGALQQALAAGGNAFSEKNKQWLGEIGSVAKLMKDDTIDRAARVQKIDAERDVAREAQAASRTALEEAVRALGEFGGDTSSDDFKKAIPRVVTEAPEDVTIGMDRIRAGPGGQPATRPGPRWTRSTS